MGRRKAQGEKGKGRRGRPANLAADLEILHEHRDTTKHDNLLAEKTTKAYEGHLKRAKDFLADVVQNARQEATTTSSKTVPLAAHLEADEEIDYAVLATAFEKPPNRYSPYALELFLTQKCIEEGCTQSLSEQVHAAFKNYWSKMYVIPSDASIVICSLGVTPDTLGEMADTADAGHTTSRLARCPETRQIHPKSKTCYEQSGTESGRAARCATMQKP